MDCAVLQSDRLGVTILGNLVCRDLAASDVEAICSLVGGAMNPEEAVQARETITHHLLCRANGIDDGRCYEVLLLNDEVAGIGGLHHYSWGPPENVWLAWFAIDPARQGQGLGGILFGRMMNKSRQLGYRKFFIETYTSPEFRKAREFYGTKGFRLGGYVSSYLPSGDDMVIFYKDLTNES